VNEKVKALVLRAPRSHEGELPVKVGPGDEIALSPEQFVRWERRGVVGPPGSSAQPPEGREPPNDELLAAGVQPKHAALLKAGGVVTVEDALTHPNLADLAGIGDKTRDEILATLKGE
jgi:hypothetical protein